LIIYHAGTGSESTLPRRQPIPTVANTPAETTFLACLKVITLFVFGFFDMIMMPAYLAGSEPLLEAAGGMFPLAIPIPSSPSLPHCNKTTPHSRPLRPHPRALRRLAHGPLRGRHPHAPAALRALVARTAPPNTRFDVTTITLINKPRVSSIVLSDLRPESGRFGMVDYVRDTKVADAKTDMIENNYI
jgi:hypothetical protein